VFLIKALQQHVSCTPYKHKVAASKNMDKYLYMYMLSITLHDVFSSSRNVSMYLSGVNLALNDVQNGDVAVVIFSVSKG